MLEVYWGKAKGVERQKCKGQPAFSEEWWKMGGGMGKAHF